MYPSFPKYASYYLESFQFDESSAKDNGIFYVTMNYHGAPPTATPMFKMIQNCFIGQTLNFIEPPPKDGKVFMYVTVYELKGDNTAIPIGRSRTNVLSFTADWKTNNKIPVLSAIDPKEKIGDLVVKLFYPQQPDRPEDIGQAFVPPPPTEYGPSTFPSTTFSENPYAKEDSEGVYQRAPNPYADL